MFSGIVEEAARVVKIDREEGTENVHISLFCSFLHELKIDQSISHNGVCLTVVDIQPEYYTVTAIRETLERSNLGFLRPGDEVNLERSMQMNGRLDGHIVQGHVDTTGSCTSIDESAGSYYFSIHYQVSKEMAKQGYMTVEKGSVCINGVSLTVCDAQEDNFKVAIIPYTLEHTNFKSIQIGDKLNIEFDIIGKYLARLKTLEG